MFAWPCYYSIANKRFLAFAARSFLSPRWNLLVFEHTRNHKNVAFVRFELNVERIEAHVVCLPVALLPAALVDRANVQQ